MVKELQEMVVKDYNIKPVIHMKRILQSKEVKMVNQSSQEATFDQILSQLCQSVLMLQG